MDPLAPIIARFDPIALNEMDGVALQARMDTKFVFAASELPALLEVLGTEYRMLEVTGERGTGYRTLYFDTPDRRFYFEHHNGYTYRSKVRMREYMNSGLCFLEVKRRTGRGGTEKRRIPIPAIVEQLTPGQAAFAANVSQCDTPLQPTLWNEFFRFTLVHHERAERLTLDTRLSFRDANGEAGLPHICVAELKEGRTGHGSPFLELMRKLPVPPTSFSKYCVGTVLLRPGIKYNQFKPILLRAERASTAV
ncbi:MAG: polyphosphate polymerase domain-containing protein [Flavobacteriales bacterium]|nr:polyphosphate polymerase domain-containing protein [Flavobacteriales bacterium]MCB0758966.1 polyphosphate polymerase domain-containing protein [Flavobacteriales bacterium]